MIRSPGFAAPTLDELRRPRSHTVPIVERRSGVFVPSLEQVELRSAGGRRKTWWELVIDELEKEPEPAWVT